MSGHKEQKSTGLTRIALNEQEVREWRRCFHVERERVSAGTRKVEPTPAEREMRAIAQIAFAKMGED